MDRVKAFLVVGVHRSGTRLMTQILLNGGCAGQATHRQVFDDGLPPALRQPIAWRRGFPHSAVWPDIPQLCQQMREALYEPHVVWIMRGAYPTWRSAVMAQMSWDEAEAEQMDLEGIYRIASGLILAKVPYTRVLLPDLVLHPDEVIGWLYERLGLEKQRETKIYDVDAKWFDDPESAIDSPS